MKKSKVSLEKDLDSLWSLYVLFRDTTKEEEILRDVINDLVGPAEDPTESKELINMWIDEAPRDKIEDRVRYYTDFRSMVDSLGGILLAYLRYAKLYEKEGVVQKTKTLLRRVNHGVKKDILSLAILNLENIARARARELYQKGYRHLWDIASANPEDIISLPLIYEKLARKSVESAKELVNKIEETVKKVKIKGVYKSDKERMKVLSALNESTGISPFDIEDFILPEIYHRMSRH